MKFSCVFSSPESIDSKKVGKHVADSDNKTQTSLLGFVKRTPKKRLGDDFDPEVSPKMKKDTEVSPKIKKDAEVSPKIKKDAEVSPKIKKDVE